MTIVKLVGLYLVSIAKFTQYQAAIITLTVNSGFESFSAAQSFNRSIRFKFILQHFNTGRFMASFSYFKKNIDSLVTAIVGFLIIFLFTRHGGIGVCPDAVVYINTAQNLPATGRLVDFMNISIVDFPAFYPLFLSACIVLTGLQPLAFAPVLNAMLFAFVIFLSGGIMEQFSIRSKWNKRALLMIIVFSPALLEVYSMVWSETLFIIWLMLFMIAMRNYLQSYSRKVLIIAALVASLAAVTRYAGVIIIATGGLLILVDMAIPLKRRIADLLIYSLISPLLLAINLLRNHFVGGTLAGQREVAVRSLYGNMQDAGSVLYDWLPFFNRHYQTAAWGVFALVIFLAWICFQHYKSKKRLADFGSIAAFFSLLYILFMMVVSSISRFEILNSRLLSPLFIPLVFVGSHSLLVIAEKVKKWNRRWVVLAAAFIFISFQYNQLSADYETWDGVKDAGIPGYTEDQWKQSPTVQFIQKDSLPFQKGFIIYSNAYDAIFFFTGRPGKFLPHKEFDNEVKDFLNDPNCYLVWFMDGENDDLVGLDFIKNIKKMKLVKQFADGAIYRYDGEKTIPTTMR
ncbi:MAG: hypothetical protein ABIN94_10215 [Ferruginibacter sp.]